MRYRTALALCVAAFMALSGTAVAQDDEQPNPFSISVMTGSTSLNEAFDEWFVELVLRTKAELDCYRRHDPLWCWGIEIPIIWIPSPYPDPWVGTIVIDNQLIDVQNLEVGSSLAVAVEPAFFFKPNSRLNGSLFVGVGFQADEGQTTTVPEVGTFRTSPHTSPMVTYGGSVGYQISDRTSLRFEARGVTVFTDEMTVRTLAGATQSVEGETMTHPFLSVGFDFRF